MNQRNYQKELDKIIEKMKEENRTPSLLLHSCCAPCTSYCLEYLTPHFSITDFFYNPNIYPTEEYEKRAREIERFISEFPVKNPVKLILPEYDPKEFYAAAAGLEDVPEGGARCMKCFELRLKKAVEKAEELKMEYVTTTLTISPLKNAQWLNAIGEHLTEKTNVKWLPSDFKKKDGYRRSTQLSEEYGLYRQDYCGCEFSRRRDLTFAREKN